MKKLTDPKILISLVIVLTVLGAFAAKTMSGGSISSGHGHSHGEEHGHEH